MNIDDCFVPVHKVGILFVKILDILKIPRIVWFYVQYVVKVTDVGT